MLNTPSLSVLAESVSKSLISKLNDLSYLLTKEDFEQLNILLYQAKQQSGTYIVYPELIPLPGFPSLCSQLTQLNALLVAAALNRVTFEILSSNEHFSESQQEYTPNYRARTDIEAMMSDCSLDQVAAFINCHAYLF